MAHSLVKVELDPQELVTILGLVKARHLDVERMVQGMSEGEGEDLQRRQALRSIEPQLELLSDLTMKLEGAQRDFER